MQLEDGVLIVLPRDEAKAFFRFREDAPRLEFIQQLLQNDAIPKASCEGEWQAMHNALSSVEIEGSLLAQAILGGRPLHSGSDYHVCLIRPDVVGFICEQGKQVDPLTFPDHAKVIQSVFELYGTAVELRGAMVFAAKI